MSFNCDECGRRSVERLGQWCNECQKREHEATMAVREEWFSKCSLCLQCANAWGNEPNDKCTAYDMPLYMVARKYKCKRYEKIDYETGFKRLEEGFY